MADGAGHPLGRHRQHGAAIRVISRAARPRSARLHADGLRRRRPAACRAPGRASSRSARVLVPRNPGILCAMGLLLTDLRADFARDAPDAARPRRRSPTSPRRFAALAERAERWFEHEGIAAGRPAPHAAPSTCATRGQNYELRGRVPDGPITAATLRRAWRRASPTRIASAVRLRRRGASRCSSSPSASRRPASCARPSFRRIPTPARTRAGAIASAATVWLAGGRRLRRTVRLRPRRAAARATASPAPPSSSRWTPPRSCLPGMTARVDPYLNLILEVA